MKLEELEIGYDLKEEFNKREELYNKDEKNHIIKFLKYRIYTKDIDCDRADINQISGKVYTHLWLGGKENLLECVDGEILNSFWTTFRKTIELSFEEYYSKTDECYSQEELTLKYEFVLLFGGLRKKEYSICKVTNMNQLKNFFDILNEKEIDNSYIKMFLKSLLYNKNYNDENYKIERFKWILKNILQIEDIIRCVTRFMEGHGKTFYEELLSFSKYYHNIGNISILMKGYNSGRALPTSDYLDLTLESMYYVLGEKSFREYIAKYYLEDYIQEDGKPKKFWEGHSFRQKEATNLSQIFEFLKIVNLNIKERDKKILKELKS